MLTLYALTNNAIKGGDEFQKYGHSSCWPARPSAQCYLVVLNNEDALLVVPFLICW